jgi:polysaccharide export outer membrane protein
MLGKCRSEARRTEDAHDSTMAMSLPPGHRRALQRPVILAAAIGLSLTACSSIYECPAESGDYRLGYGDALRVTVFGHEDLSGEFTLDAEGNFSLPPVGEIRGGGQTARQLEAEIGAALSSYLLDPQVSIEILNYRRFYVLGEVKVPGSFEYIDA